MSQYYHAEALDYSTVSLHSPDCIYLPLGLCKETVSGLWKWWKFPSNEPTNHCHWGNPNLHIYQPIIKGWCQSIGDLISYPTDSPAATRLGLCSSLRRLGKRIGLSIFMQDVGCRALHHLRKSYCPVGNLTMISSPEWSCCHHIQ